MKANRSLMVSMQLPFSHAVRTSIFCIFIGLLIITTACETAKQQDKSKRDIPDYSADVSALNRLFDVNLRSLRLAALKNSTDNVSAPNTQLASPNTNSFPAYMA